MSTLIQTIKDLDSSINSKKTMLKNTINASAPGTITEDIPTLDKINESLSKIEFGLAAMFELITDNKTWVCPDNIASKVSIRVFGGGGGGGYGSHSSYVGGSYGSGGGGGGHMSYKELDITAGTKVTCSIGAGGAGGNGKAGAGSSFGSFVSANGGDRANGTSGGSGGSGGGGGWEDGSHRILLGGSASYGGRGGDGRSGYGNTLPAEKAENGIDTSKLVNKFMVLGPASAGSGTRTNGGGGGGGGFGGNGGDSYDRYGDDTSGGGGGGYGGKGGTGNYNGDGTAGTGYGSGGGGGGTNAGNSLNDGGAGAKGCILISYLLKVKKETILPI